MAGARLLGNAMKKYSLPLVIAFTLSAAAVVSAGADKNSDKAKKPSLKVKASPAIAFSPARVVLTGDLSGGNSDNEQLYCAAIEWQWGDGTKSDQKADCDPYVAGKSEVKRHFVVDRVFDTPAGGGLVRVMVMRAPSLKFDNRLGGTIWLDRVGIVAEPGSP